MRQLVRTAPPALPAVLRAPLSISAALATAVLVALGILHFHDSGLTGFDAALLPSIDGVRPPWRYVALVFDFGGEPVGSAILIALLAGVCWLVHRVRAAVLTVLGVVVTVAVTTVLKPLVGRTIHGEFLSYPSGHTAMATALALVIGLVLTERWALGRAAGVSLALGVALVAGLAMGWAEVALGAHYPTDAVGGFCAALAAVPATAWALDRVADRL
ncbi:integral membrane protein [Amycolatopsis mediterranei S699]|uniref:Integral membrane protein n=2 Tax=Amycolatopsis mediterranei TaxID=33910 RepID=A0A0H3CUS5_AMYMU|nr:phosphatase PAP2 family protein [Amycolatopsis mediterranei]ADJ42377.1 integral membrane protein [Amycolatopsis mediterranei U32]AEK39063.1 integral membrane protein [Amycolatopsis mediterranei S699]AFO74091.1 integral membrane protein [Amycolatopsis mediterranei S699]AGT81220.1 integral membrane protein [Amycolatopsis mediterranei RB]KDO09714.1 membrane protein [Amycolatopsis mediterranei]